MPDSPCTASPRLLAWQVLGKWSPDGEFAEELISRAAERHALSRPNRALLQAIVLGVLRNVSLLDLWIDHMRGGGALDHATRRWLRIGLVQCLIIGLPDHAAVNETVALAGRSRNLVNALLRRALRSREELERLRRDAPPHIRYSLPEFLMQRWIARFGGEAAARLGGWCNQPAPVTVRVNRLMTDRLTEPGCSPPEKYPGFLVCGDLPRRDLAAGRCYAQDPSTSLAPLLLAPEPDHDVLDACAAPGGKAAILAELAGNSGRLTVADRSPDRVARLRSNLQRMGVRTAAVVVHDWESGGPLPDNVPAEFDRILLDAPCSNTGVLRRRVDVRWRLNPGFLGSIVDRQRILLRSLLPRLKPGGRLVYSTCSIEDEENAGVVRSVLADMPGFRQLQAQGTLPHVDDVDGSWASLIERTA